MPGGRTRRKPLCLTGIEGNVMELRDWTILLRRAGVAYAAIVLSIMGINIPADATLSKKASEHSTAPGSAEREMADDSIDSHS
jgi:hypothetical protein